MYAFSITRFVIPVALAAVLAACQTSQQLNAPVNTAVASLAAAPVLRQDQFHGIYEISTAADGLSIFVATVGDGNAQGGGLLHRLDARTLQTLQTIQTPRRSYALGLNQATQTLFVGNTREGALTVVDAMSGMVKGQIQLAQPSVNDKGVTTYAHTRKVIVDAQRNRVFVTSPSEPGMVWIVDTASNTLTHTVASEGLWTAGAAYDSVSNVLYVGQAGQHEVLAIDPDTGRVMRTFSTGDSADNTGAGAKHFFVNLALDSKGQRLFATDANTDQLYVLDLTTGQFVSKVGIEGLGLLDVVYNPVRNEVITSSRGVSSSQPSGIGVVTILDARTFAVKQRFDVPVHPNSLALSPDGQVLYVTVKSPNAKHPAWRKNNQDSVVRFDLSRVPDGGLSATSR
ncbi:YncE family protein [Lampropedia puyangensis]|uniref:YncE family protein n=1 Tax=Lampropedia puyangensis TaxID=1330072 RepID=A0A4S8F762_9BURK|nr:PQQ-binding-like beta-propeller repeat protein [Lampropedia puyangensis]THU02515.1 YncE family protein [Lampropedia puyangensis]